MGGMQEDVAPPLDLPLHVAPTAAPAGALEADIVHKVSKLRERAHAEMKDWAAGAAEEATALLDDFTLARYIQARPEGVTEALQMLRESCEWRVERRVGHLFSELHPYAPDLSSLRCRTRHLCFYSGVGGLCRDGRPYFVERLGQADLAGYVREGEPMLNLMTDCYSAHLELVFRTVRLQSASSGKLVKAVIVVDASGVSFSTIRHISIVKLVAKIGTNKCASRPHSVAPCASPPTPSTQPLTAPSLHRLSPAQLPRGWPQGAHHQRPASDGRCLGTRRAATTDGDAAEGERSRTRSPT